jgi:hypothetical protein
VIIPVTFTISGRTTAGVGLGATGSYAIGLEAVRAEDAAGITTNSFMAGDAAWRTNAVSIGGQGN